MQTHQLSLTQLLTYMSLTGVIAIKVNSNLWPQDIIIIGKLLY